MTKLEAVNAVLLACGIPRVTALDAGAEPRNSPEGLAEIAIDDAQRKIEHEIQIHGTQSGYFITCNNSIAASTGTITAVSVASPTELTTSAAHSLVVGQNVTIAGETADRGINGTHRVVSSADNTHFKIAVAVTAAVAGTITFSGAAGGRIVIPSSTVEIDTSGGDVNRNLIPDFTNNWMYDQDNQTDVFDASEKIEFTIVSRKAFTYIAPPIQEYIVARAAFMHNTRYGFPGRMQVLAEEERRARGRARAYDTHQRGVNMLSNINVQETRGGRLGIPGIYGQ